jgi:hypothetical protein
MTTLRGPGVKSVGKPDAGNRPVRFDERGRETGLLAPRPSSTLPKNSRLTALDAMKSFSQNPREPRAQRLLTPLIA